MKNIFDIIFYLKKQLTNYLAFIIDFISISDKYC